MCQPAMQQPVQAKGQRPTNCSGLYDNNGPSATKLLSHYLNRNSRAIQKSMHNFPFALWNIPRVANWLGVAVMRADKVGDCSVVSVGGWWFCLNSPRVAIRWPCAVLLALYCIETGRMQQTTAAHFTVKVCSFRPKLKLSTIMWKRKSDQFLSKKRFNPSLSLSVQEWFMFSGSTMLCQEWRQP